MLTRAIAPTCWSRSQTKRDRFSSVGAPSASTLLSSLWSSIFWTSAIPCWSRPRSSTIPVAGSGVPRTVTSARNEWPWTSSLAAPSVVPRNAWAASNRNDFVTSHIAKIQILSDTECLVRLQAEPPLRMAQTVIDRARGVLDHVRSVHRLQREPFEIKIGESLRRRVLLRVDQLELMPPLYHEVRAGFRADANPVHAGGRIDRTIGLDADLEAARMQRVDQRPVYLQQRLAAGQDHVAVFAARPLRGDGIGKRLRRSIAAAQRSVGSDKIGVAKPAGRGGAVLLAAAPEVAAGKPAEHRRAAGMRAFALQGQKDFLDRVAHRVASLMVEPVCRSASPNAIAAATATFSERRPGLIGIASRASTAVTTSSGTPADSRPNSRMSSAS